MNFKKSITGAVVGAVMSVSALTACGPTHSTTAYDRVYDTHTHSYVVVTDDYYRSHRSRYSGTVTHVQHTTTVTHHKNGKKTVKKTTITTRKTCRTHRH